jgi:hypothetical protein
MISRRDARGVKTVYGYKDSAWNDDPLDRLQSVSYDRSGVPGSLTVAPPATVTYQYRSKPSASVVQLQTNLRRGH